MNSKRAKRIERGEVERREVEEEGREMVRMVRVLRYKLNSGERKRKDIAVKVERKWSQKIRVYCFGT